MSFADYANKTKSRKIVLANIDAKEKVKLFEPHSGAVYKRYARFYVAGVKVNGVPLVSESSEALSAGAYYYNPINGMIYIRCQDDSDPVTNSVVLTYRLFFSNYPANLPVNFTSGEVVHYESRVKSIGNLKLELDFENTGIALETNSNITLENNDGFFDDIFDTLIWENSSVKFYSWSDAINPSDAKLIYKGLVSDKSFSSTEIKLNLKDELSKLRQSIEVGRFSSLDGDIDSSVNDRPKRLLFGRADKLRTTGIDKTLEGFNLTGTLSGSADRNLLNGTVSGFIGLATINGTGTNFLTALTAGDKIKVIDFYNEYTFTVSTVVSNTQITVSPAIPASFNLAQIRNLQIDNNIVTGIGTLFRSELSPSDKLKVTVNQVEYEYGVKTINSDTELVLEDQIDASFLNATVKNLPEIPYSNKNRRWHIAGHKLREYSVNITAVIDFTNIEVDNISDLQQGDYVLINGDYYVILNVSSNKLRLNQSLRSLTSVGDLVTKIPVWAAYVGSQRFIINRDFTVTNTTTDAILEFNNLAEFNVTVPKNPSIIFNFTTGSRLVTISATDIDLTSFLRPRDWIRPSSINITNWYEVQEVNQTTLTLRTLSLDTFSGPIQYKAPQYIDDNSLVTVDCLGLEEGSEWIRYPSHAVKWLLEKADLTDINAASFGQASDDCQFPLCLYYPSSIGNEMPSVRDMVTAVNNSVFGSLYLDNNFSYTYKILNADKPENLVAVKDEDILNFTVTTKSNIFNSVVLSYSPYVDIQAGVETFKTVVLESDFVNETVEKKEQLKATSYLYNPTDAQIIAERWLFFRSLTQSVVTINSKLNFALNTLNDPILLDLERLYRRYGGGSRRKIGIINSISKNGTSTIIQVNDLGNVFSRVPAIAPDDEPDYTYGTESVDKYGYVLDNDTETPNPSSEYELGTNLIG